MIRCIFIAMIILSACGPGGDAFRGSVAYINDLKATDSAFYFLPYRDSFSRIDSMMFALSAPDYFLAFEEPNLSLAALKEPQVRLLAAENEANAQLISLFPDRIVVKTASAGGPEMYSDFRRLSREECQHLRWMQQYYPFDSATYRAPLARRRGDSLRSLFPHLANPRYYLALEQKSKARERPFRYRSSEVAISSSQYLKLMEGFRSAGFWKMPWEMECAEAGSVAHAQHYILEANTPFGYRMVQWSSCPNNRHPIRIASQDLVDVAGLRSTTNLIWNTKTIVDTLE